ncbi:2-deoxy-D-gluconate 3-dehydrogenase [candidate division KSB1 bacterium]|nr:MAG: 2-deoxy-D-gluconate 3-dehydrogenase [candidate division KSB1 bacterium]RKY81425.1 MAG: 2-deoxy-D-gluconate 3-dehydrogenase [candidate division KSB1 bacterium]
MILEKFSLKGKAGIVTGASRGIGKGIAEGLVQAGANLAICARSLPALEKTAEELRKYGTEVIPIKADVSMKAEVEKLVNKTVEEFGRIDFLFNNAGITYRAPSEDFPEEWWDEVIRVNLKSVFLCSQAVARVMIKQGGGKIINTSSLIAVTGGKTISAYAASKGGVAQLTKALANDWAKYHINVNAIGPGYIITDLTAPLIDDKQRYQELSARIPMGRWGKPEDLAGAAVFLASEASDYITGQTIFVDGGWLSA